MKITDIQVIPFTLRRRPFRNGELLPETTITQTLTKILTDEGAEGYYFGGSGHGDMDGMSPEQAAVLTGKGVVILARAGLPGANATFAPANFHNARGF